MRHIELAYLGAGLAFASFFALFPFRQPDIPHRVLDRKYSDHRSSFFEGPNGEHIHCRDEGRVDGPAILLVHGYCASLHTWERWAAQLGQHYRLISIDLPGHGLTRTPRGYRVGRDNFTDVIDAAAAHHGLDRFVLVGSSMGGAAAWDYARREPGRVEALVLIGAAGWAPEVEIGDAAMLSLLRSPMGPLLRDLDSTPLMRRGLRASFADPDLADDRMIARHVELARAPMHRDVQMQLALDASERLHANAEILSEIQAPTLVIHGEEDRLVPVGDGVRFASAIPNAHLIVYEDVGHIVHEEIPEQSADDVHAFLQQALALRHMHEIPLIAA